MEEGIHSRRRFTTGAAVAILLVVMLIAPALWLLAARLLGYHLRSNQDPLGLLTSVGAFMGTVFVVGGLVIALASLVTLFDVDRRLEHRVNELIPHLERRADRQIQAHILVREAEGGFIDWKGADAKAKEALALYPDVHGARVAAGMQASHAVRAWFEWSHGYRSADAATYGRIPDQEVPLLEAIAWLEGARTHKEGTPTRIAAELALMYAIGRRYDKSLTEVRAAAANSDERAYLTFPGRLIVLAYACKSVEQLTALGSALGVELPAPTDQIVDSWKAIDTARPGLNSLDWWVVVRSSDGGTELSLDAESPSVVRLFRGLTEDGQPAARAYWIAPGRSTRTIPDNQSWPPLLDVVGELQRRFAFVCSATPALTPYDAFAHNPAELPS